jgi:hypothetical protein
MTQVPLPNPNSFPHLSIFNNTINTTTTTTTSSSTHTMSNANADWDSKLVVGQKAKAPKVTKNASDLNGT